VQAGPRFDYDKSFRSHVFKQAGLVHWQCHVNSTPPLAVRACGHSSGTSVPRAHGPDITCIAPKLKDWLITARCMNSRRRVTISHACRHRGDASVPTPGVLVTGGASGLGKTICDVFYGDGYNVVCVDIMPINKRDFPLGARRCAARGMRAWEGGEGLWDALCLHDA
jgi:hypothetical protein